MSDTEKNCTLRMVNNVTKKEYAYENMEYVIKDGVFTLTVAFNGDNMPDAGEYRAKITDSEGNSVYNGLLQIGEVKRKGSSRQYDNGVTFTQYNG